MKKSKEEDKFIDSLFNYDEDNIFNTPNMGVRA